MSYFVYVIGSLKHSKPKTYVGWTKDLSERLRKHNQGKGAKSTRGRREYYLKKDRNLRSELRKKI